VDRVVGLEGVRVDIAMLETPDGHGQLELMKFHSPPARDVDRNAPPNTLGIRRVAFSVDDIDAAVAGLQARGVELLGGVERYEDSYRLCYVRGPEGSSSCSRSRLAEGPGPRPVASWCRRKSPSEQRQSGFRAMKLARPMNP
jgi:hypothetical protein